MSRLPVVERSLTKLLRAQQRQLVRQGNSDAFVLSGITPAGDGTATLASEEWNFPDLLNAWVNYGFGRRVAGCTRTVDGSVKLRGFTASGAAGVPMFTLPPGYTPTADETFVAQAGGNGTARVDVLVNGDVVVVSYNGTGTNAFLSMSGIRFSLNG